MCRRGGDAAAELVEGWRLAADEPVERGGEDRLADGDALAVEALEEACRALVARETGQLLGDLYAAAGSGAAEAVGRRPRQLRRADMLELDEAALHVPARRRRGEIELGGQRDDFGAEARQLLGENRRGVARVQLLLVDLDPVRDDVGPARRAAGGRGGGNDQGQPARAEGQVDDAGLAAPGALRGGRDELAMIGTEEDPFDHAPAYPLAGHNGRVFLAVVRVPPGDAAARAAAATGLAIADARRRLAGALPR